VTTYGLRGIPPGNMIEVPAQGYLLVGDGGPILVDAGYRDPSVLGAGGTIAEGQGFHEQLAQHGLEAGDLRAVIMTHLHRDHAGHLHEVPMSVPVIVNRSELAVASTGIQGHAYAREDVLHLIERVYSPGAIRFLDLESSGPVEIAPGITCVLSGGHTTGSLAVVVPTTQGEAYLCGDLFYDIEGSLRNQPQGTFVARVQPSALALDDPALSNNFTTAVAQELGAIKKSLRYRFLLAAHDDPGVLEHGRYVGRILGDTVPGEITLVEP
jgi:N-acyl homoserine lactone hydrolase